MYLSKTDKGIVDIFTTLDALRKVLINLYIPTTEQVSWQEKELLFYQEVKKGTLTIDPWITFITQVIWKVQRIAECYNPEHPKSTKPVVDLRLKNILEKLTGFLNLKGNFYKILEKGYATKKYTFDYIGIYNEIETLLSDTLMTKYSALEGELKKPLPKVKLLIELTNDEVKERSEKLSDGYKKLEKSEEKINLKIPPLEYISKGKSKEGINTKILQVRYVS